MVLSSFVTMEIKTLSKERSAFAADAEQTPLIWPGSKHELILYIIEVAHYWAAFFIMQKG
ncbi:hypothetical protein BSK47_28895 [Paenibacillus odorifer]|uniref:Uncharacterized protein n=1 Tax=Paenibacillus odorifer TaxID=189426 RepID=A0AB36J6G6_9BACL|nr:hypothetical protein BSK47_28895 [Paenibacillus odorifer]